MVADGTSSVPFVYLASENFFTVFVDTWSMSGSSSFASFLYRPKRWLPVSHGVTWLLLSRRTLTFERYTYVVPPLHEPHRSFPNDKMMCWLYPFFYPFLPTFVHDLHTDVRVLLWSGWPFVSSQRQDHRLVSLIVKKSATSPKSLSSTWLSVPVTRLQNLHMYNLT